MQFQIYSIIQVRRTKVFTIYLLIVRMRKKSQCCLVKKIRGYMYNKIYKYNNLCKNKHIACEIYESYAKIFMKFDIKEIEK